LSVTIHQAERSTFLDRMPILLPSLVWILALGAILVAIYLRGSNVMPLLPLFGVASVPGVLGIILARETKREWVQIFLMLSWATLALLACLTFGFWPMALLFITVPALACLFEREKVLEGTLIAALIAGVVWFAGRLNYLPDVPLRNDGAEYWSRISAMAGLLAFGLATLFGAASNGRQNSSQSIRTYWRDGVEGGLFEFDTDANLVGMNSQGAEQFADHIPKTLHDFLPEGHLEKVVFEKAIEAAKNTKRAQKIRIYETSDDLSSSYDMRITKLVSKGWLIHTSDRTDDVANLMALQHEVDLAAQESTDKTHFFAGVSHELRTPLNAIIGFSDMMRSRLFGPLPGKYAEYADLIHGYELNYDTFDASDVIRSSVKMIRPAADAAEVSLDINLDLDQALLIQADRRAVRQILLNLLSNAVKFSDRGGHVEIDAQAIDGDLELSVTDNGAGMSEEELANVGAPYLQGEAGKQSDERGSGLGLSLVQSLTELHKGKMDIMSEKGDGTRVKITLPLHVD